MRKASTSIPGQRGLERLAKERFANGFNPAVDHEWKSKGTRDLHCHLDRGYSWDEVYYEHDGGRDQFVDAPLWMKQDAVGAIHRGLAFTPASLWMRDEYTILKKIEAGEKELWAITDCSPDIGDRSFRIALALKSKYAKQIDIKVGAYPIFGFKSYTSAEGKARIGLIRDLAPEADFLVGLPERDARPEHAEVGFDGHLAILIELAVKHGKPLQVHLDQSGRSDESGTKRFIEAVRWLVTNNVPASKRPRMIAVHAISPSAYIEEDFVSLLGGMRENDIELCACIHAAGSMLPPRDDVSPGHNIVARVLEASLAGVRVSLGTDNIRDLFMPRPVSPLLTRELDIFATNLRFYNSGVIYKLACGEPLNNSDFASIKRNLDINYTRWKMPQGTDALLAMNPAFQG